MQDEMHAEAQKSITQQVMKARVETMLDFQRGEASIDDIPDTVRIYNEAYPDDAFLLMIWEVTTMQSSPLRMMLRMVARHKFLYHVHFVLDN